MCMRTGIKLHIEIYTRGMVKGPVSKKNSKNLL
jgi:hypothetical protein